MQIIWKKWFGVTSFLCIVLHVLIILYIIYIYKKNIKPVLKRSDHIADIDVQQRATLRMKIIKSAVAP